jgi:hypothetical protein
MRSEAEIKDKLEDLRKQYAESEKNPVKTFQDRNNKEYFIRFEKRQTQRKDEIDWIGEIAILEWVLKEKPTCLTSWARKELDEKKDVRA